MKKHILPHLGTILHKALEKALHYGLVTYNPAHGATLPRYIHSGMQVLDEDQIYQFPMARSIQPVLCIVSIGSDHRDEAGRIVWFEMG